MTAKTQEGVDSRNPLQELIAAVREQNVSGAENSERLSSAVAAPGSGMNGETNATIPFLSVLLIPGDSSTEELTDVLVALDAQSVNDFELIMSPSPDLPDERRRLGELLAQFSSGLSDRSLIVSAHSGQSTNRHEAAAIDAGIEAAHGRYLCILDGRTIVFAHYVETFERLSTDHPGAVLRTLAVAQAMHRLAWPDGRVGFEPVTGAKPMSSSRFDLLRHLVESETPRGSYALPRSFLDSDHVRYLDALVGSEEDEVLLEAVLRCGICEATDNVTILLRTFIDEAEGVSGTGVGSLSEDPTHTLHDGVQDELESARISLRETQLRLDRAQLDLTSTRAELSALRGSTSWRLTSPLRRLTGALRRAKFGTSATKG